MGRVAPIVVEVVVRRSPGGLCRGGYFPIAWPGMLQIGAKATGLRV